MEKKVLRLLYTVRLDIKNKANPSSARVDGGIWSPDPAKQILCEGMIIIFSYSSIINLLSMILMERL